MDNLEKILQELIEADPKLAEHKDQLRQLLVDLLKRRPDIEMDAEFKARLREAVWAKIESVGTPKFAINGLWSKLAFAGLGGALVATVVFVPMMFKGQPDSGMMSFSAFNIEDVGDEAFGNLSDSTDMAVLFADGLGSGGGGEVSEEVEVRSEEEAKDDDFAVTESSTEEAPLATADPDAGAGGGGGWVSDESYYYDDALYYPTYKYTYVGDELSYEQGTVSVLRKQPDYSLGHLFGSLLGGVDTGLIDLSNFEDMDVSYINFVPKDQKGYAIWMDYNFGETSISYFDPKTEYAWRELSADDMLSDTELIKLSDDFMAQYNISLEGYGDPEVQELDIYNDYYPEYANVTYPVVLDGQQVYTDWGSKAGIQVTINMRDSRVDYVSGITSWNLESSNYPSIDYDQIIDAVEQGGTGGWLYAYDYYGETGEIEVQLGTPYQGYMQTWQYENNTSYQIYVPAYIFPVVNDVRGLYNDYVVVPLVADLFSWYEYPVIEPYLIEEEEVDVESDE